MAIRLESEAVRRERSIALQALHAQWAADQIAAGVDGATPDDRPEPSDYSQHVPDLEAPAAALDDFWARVDQILLS